MDEGDDFIESDILVMKNGVLICHHDSRSMTPSTWWITLSTTGFFIGMFQIVTFEEYISIDLDADQVIGIYPEIKNPVYVNDHVKWVDGKMFKEKFVEMLQNYGYNGASMTEDWLKQPAFIRSFAPTSLVYISNLTDLPKVFLIDDVTVITEDTNQTYWEITSDSYFNYIKDYCIGIGPWKDNIIPPNSSNFLEKATDEVAGAHALGMQVHPYTYRNKNSFLHFDFNQDPYAEYDFWINKAGVDGLLTDFTGSLHKYQEWSSTPKGKRASRAFHRIAFFQGLYY